MMRRLSLILALFIALGSCLAPALEAAPSAPAAQAAAPARADKSPAAGFSAALSTVTGIAISPLLGTGAYGAYQYMRAEEQAREKLPWYAQPTFFIPALLIVLIVAFKDSIAAALPPGFKKPLDVIETIENKATGLIAAGAVVPFTMDSLSKLITSSSAPELESVRSGLATLTFGAIDLHWLLNILTVPFGVAMFAVVWMASHAINVLILLSPWGAIDTALKSARTALLGLLTLTAVINPWAGAILSLIIIVISYLVAGWAFRLTVFGSVFCWDFFTLRKHRFQLVSSGNRLFSGSLLTSDKVPVRTYGTLTPSSQPGAKWTFSYRPWLIGRLTTVEVEPTRAEIGKGLFFSTVRRGEDGSLFLLPPRYRGHEEQMVALYSMPGGVQPAGIRKAWAALRELFSGKSSAQAVA